MATKSVENGQEIRPEVLYIQLDHDDKEEDMVIDRMFAEMDETQRELYIQRQLNFTVRGRI